MKTQKLFTLLATTALLVPTFSNGVSALEEVTQDISTQEVATNPTPEETAPQPETTQPKQEAPVEDTLATLPNPSPTPVLAREDRSLIPSAIAYSGTWGTVEWTLTDDGVLTLGAGTLGDMEDRPWNSGVASIIDADLVQELEIAGPVIIPHEGAEGYGYALFASLHNLTSITGLPNLDTSNCTNLSGMFAQCYSLETLDLRSFDTSNATKLQQMFQGCSSLEALDLHLFDTSNCTDMYEMFQSCSSLTTLDLSAFDTSNVEKMTYMFKSCSSLETLDLHSFDTSNVLTMESMFEYCSSLKTLDLRSFNIPNVNNMDYMFHDCSSLGTLDLNSSFNNSEVEYARASGMFYNCSSLKALDLHSFKGNLNYMPNMFNNCSSLKTLDLSSLDNSRINYYSYSILGNCTSLQYLTIGANMSLQNTSIPAINTTGDYNGWWVNLATGKFYTSSSDFINNYDFTPGTYEWVKKSYNISYSLNGGTATESLPTSYSPDTGVNLPDATKPDATFVGWFDAKGVKWADVPQGTIGDVALTARYFGDPRIEIQDITPKVTKGATYQWKINDHSPSYYDEYGEKIEMPFYAKLNGKIYDQNDTVALAEGTYEVEITNERPLSRATAVTTTAKITITATEPEPTPDTGNNTNTDNELKNKILDITKDYNLSNDAQNNIAKELEEKAKNGTLSLDDIKQIIQKYAPNLSASDLEELAGKLYKLLYPNSPLLPSTNETKQAGLTLLGVVLIGLGITVFWIRRKRKI